MKNNSKQNHNTQKEDVKNTSSSVMRKCCACGKITDRKDFIRIMRDYKTGKMIINPNNMQFGRSFYLCKTEECIKLAIKKKRLKSLSEKQLEKIKEYKNAYH